MPLRSGAARLFAVNWRRNLKRAQRTMGGYILHCFGQSGNAYKVALMLNLCGCEWRPRFVDFFNGETRSPEFRDTCNEMGEVPVLEHDGQRFTQSGAILVMLAERHGRFGGRDTAERYDILRWILFDNHKFTSYLATLRFMVGLRKMPESPVTEFLRNRTLAAFDIVEKHLDRRSFIVGDTPTIADISMVGYLYYPEETGIGRSAFPNIEAWTRRIAALPGWAHPYDLMPR